MIDMEFKPLGHAPWIMNAVVPVKEHVQLSVSYNDRKGMWHVGEKGSYEVAVQMTDPGRYPGIACLVSFEDNPSGNIWPDCDDSRIAGLVEKGKALTYAGAVEVFDVRQGASEKAWGIRFLCAEGYDKTGKLEYARDTWGADGHRFVPAGHTLDMAGNLCIGVW